ncbi:MAG: asparagine synthetase B, partial [Romboutsia sp.]|nr:asparagine synthetase B [Romboutsia sp.]
MCGISGYYKINTIASNLTEATQILIHRGPDSFGLYENGNVGLGHRRLSIIDLSNAGHQPMKSDSGRYIIVYNGEIY